MQRWCTEAVGEGSAQGISRNRFITQSNLAVHRIAEIREMFVASGDRCGEAFDQIGVKLDITGIAAAIDVGCTGGRNAGKTLSTGCGGAAREAASRAYEIAPLRGAVGRCRIGDRCPEQRPGCKALDVARDDLEILNPQLGTECNRQRLGKADIIFAADVDILDNLPEAQAAGVEGPLAGGPERGVKTVADGIVETIMSVTDRKIDIP